MKRVLGDMLVNSNKKLKKSDPDTTIEKKWSIARPRGVSLNKEMVGLTN